MNQQVVTINKITAASCQIDTAIEVIFRNTDVVSPIVLTSSAWSLIKDLLKINKEKDFSRTWMVELFPPEDGILSKDHANSIYKKLDEPWNFFKHAEFDHSKLLKIADDIVESMLLLVIHDFSLLAKESLYMDTYKLWFYAKNKDIFDRPITKDLYSSACEIFSDIGSKSLAEQRNQGLKEIMKL